MTLFMFSKAIYPVTDFIMLEAIIYIIYLSTNDLDNSDQFPVQEVLI